MNISGEFVINAPRQAVFDSLRDARFFASCVEGVRDLEEIGADAYRAVLETKIAYIRFKFEVKVELTEMEPTERISARVEGVPMGVVGRLSGESRAVLVETDANTTIVQYSMDVALTGKLGALGQPVLRSKAREMERNFTGNLRAALEAPAEAGA